MGKKLKLRSKDEVVHRVVEKFDERSAIGYKKYGKTLSKDSDSLYRWVNDVQEELMDAILYMEKVKQTLQELAEESYIQDYKKGMLSDYPESSMTMYPGDIEVTYTHIHGDKEK